MAKVEGYGVSRRTAWSLVTVRPALTLFLSSVLEGAEPQIAARMLAIDLKGLLRKLGKDVHSQSSWPPPSTIRVISEMIKEGVYTYDEVKYNILPRLAEDPNTNINVIMPRRASNIEETISAVLSREKKAVADFLSGKEKALDYLVGAVLKVRRGEAVDPKSVRELILKVLASTTGDPSNRLKRS
jgi:aspartyl-tRNA(Asn)/glutamyl-tRNA(Gln) amidotransferase subunit B